MIGIVGASGLIGYNFYGTLKQNKQDVVGTYFTRKRKGLREFDLKNGDFLIFNQCNYVVIASAVTCIEVCYLKRAEAYRINVEKTIELIKYLADRKIKPIFLSSDQVFDGEKGNYTEEDKPYPINCYGDFKLQVEEFMKNNLEDYLILRLSKTYSRNLKERGIFSETLLKLRKGQKVQAAHNQIFNPTDVRVVCDGMGKAIDANLKGLYHLADPRIMSRYEFALSIACEYGFDKDLIEPIDIRSLSLTEKRPLNTSLNVQKINEAIPSQPRGG